MNIEVLLVDDDTMLRENLRHRLELESDIRVVGAAANCAEGVKLARKLRPEVVVMDIRFKRGEMNGVQATEEILKIDENIRVIALSINDELVFVKQMVSLGASGYILKGNTTTELIEAIRAVTTGQHYFSKEVKTAMLEDYLESFHRQEKPKPVKLSERELEILRLIVKEYNPKEIADRLNITPKTVATHRLNLQKKLGIFTEAGLTKYAIREGIITAYE